MRAPPAIDLYAVLGVTRSATGAEIRRAYRQLALKHHPDRAGAASAETFARIAEAYRMLSEPTARTAYDAHLFERESVGAARSGGAPADGSAWSVSAVGWNASFRRPIPNLLARFAGTLEELTSSGAARIASDGVLELQLTAAEIRRGGSALVAISMSILCPTCGGVASPRGVWCRRCEHAGRVTDTVPVQVTIPPAARDGIFLSTTVHVAGATPPRTRLRIAG
jgi:DnaJ-class molecular chaperone